MGGVLLIDVDVVVSGGYVLERRRKNARRSFTGLHDAGFYHYDL